MTSANKYFVDDSRVTFTLSSDAVDGRASMARRRSTNSLHAMGMADAPPAAGNGAGRGRAADARRRARSGHGRSRVRRRSRQPRHRSSTWHSCCNVGAALDPEGKKGLATMTAAMLAGGGSQAKTIDEINAAMFPMAAGFGAQVDKEMTRLVGPGAQGQSRCLVRTRARPAAVPGLVRAGLRTHSHADEERHSHRTSSATTTRSSARSSCTRASTDRSIRTAR